VTIPLALFASALAAHPDAATAAGMSGTWRLAEGRPVVQARVTEAVEGMLAPLNVIVRGIARPRLAATATFCDGYQITVTTASFSLACDDRPPITLGFDQPPFVGTTPDGGAYEATATSRDGAVFLTFAASAGVQGLRYTLAGGALEVEKSLAVQQLGARLAWNMRYTRQ
jgi:hypothetical protein